MAERIAALSPALAAGSVASSFAPSQVRIASKMAPSFSRCILEPATSEATFCSSTTFQLTKASMSGWSASTITIFAARLVVPPDLIAPAARSPMRRNPISPDERPPPESASPSPRRLEKLVPVPEPYLKSRASRTHRSMMPPSFTRSSEQDWMKQACGWGCS